jgi:hypothetical protein
MRLSIELLLLLQILQSFAVVAPAWVLARAPTPSSKAITLLAVAIVECSPPHVAVVSSWPTTSHTTPAPA